jgi:hypothetical protein
VPKINLSVPHRLGQDEAKNRVARLIAETRVQFGDKISNVQEMWNGNIDTFRFNAMGFDIDGRLDVQPAEVRIEINFPWAALPFKGQMEKQILKHAGDLLA